MPMSDYLREIRQLVGTRVLCLPAVTAVIQDEQGRVLLVQDKGTTSWAFPGGMIEPGERPASAVVREMQEELNVDIEPLSLVGVFGGEDYFVQYPNGDQVNYITSVFRCRIVNGTIEADGDELQDTLFIPLSEISSTDVEIEPWVFRVLDFLAQHAGHRQFEAAQ